MYIHKYPNRNRYSIQDDIGTLIILRRSGEEVRVLFDTDDYPAVNSRIWRVQTGGGRDRKHVISGISTASTFLARLLMNTPENQECFHANGNTLDCRKVNLRNGSHSDMAIVRDRRNPSRSATGELYIYLKPYCPRRPFCVEVGGSHKYYATLAEAVAERDRRVKGCFPADR